jgi:uncharacterized protein (TIGR02246 family)
MEPCATVAQPPAMTTATTPEETHAAIAAAFNAGDLEAYVDAYEAGAVVLTPPEGRPARGLDEIRASAAPLFALEPTVEIDVIEKVESDGLALTLAHWRLAGTEADGTPVELSGRGSIVSRRQPDGRWLIVLDIPVRPG